MSSLRIVGAEERNWAQIGQDEGLSVKCGSPDPGSRSPNNTCLPVLSALYLQHTRQGTALLYPCSWRPFCIRNLHTSDTLSKGERNGVKVGYGFLFWQRPKKGLREHRALQDNPLTTSCQPHEIPYKILHCVASSDFSMWGQREVIALF